MTRQNWRLVVLFILSVSFSACKKKEVKDVFPPQEEKKSLVSATVTGSQGVLQLKLLAALNGYDAVIPLIKNDVSYLKIVYKTTYRREGIYASGLLVLPKNMTGVPSIISAQHGTTLLEAAAPSNVPSPDAFTGYELLSTAGFITVIPDYIGYGASDNLVHPYYDKEHAAVAVVDMLKAVTEYLKEEKIAFNERLFMLGYSEGGYVTMAAQQSIEERPIEGLLLKAVAAGAGGYDITGMLNSMVSRETYGDPAYLAFILHSYNVTNAWNRQMSEFFKSAYASKVAGLLDGSRDSDAVNEQLSTSPATLLDATFYANIQNPNEEKVLKAALAANSLTNWAPKTSTRLYHGTADETVFYENSQLTFQKLKAAGAASISLTPIPGGTHESAILPMMMDAITWFQSLDK